MANRGGSGDTEVTFGANIDDLKNKLGQVSGMFSEVTSKFAALAALAAGGMAFKVSVDEAIRFNEEAIKIARTVGITATEAGILNTALDDISNTLGNGGVNADTYTSAFMKFNRTLRNSSDELKEMGVDVDSLKNGQKTSNEVFLESIQLVSQYKQGTDQTNAAMKLFGRSVGDIQGLMLLTTEAMEAAKKANDELNLGITQEGVKAAEDYKSAMDGVGDILDGMQKTIGEMVMPMLTEMATSMSEYGPQIIQVLENVLYVFIQVWSTIRETIGVVAEFVVDMVKSIGESFGMVFGEDGPSAMEVFKNALRLVQIAFIAFRVAIETIVTIVRSGLIFMGQLFVNFAEVGEKALRFDFIGANAAWRRGLDERADILKDAGKNIADIARKGGEDIDKALMDPMTRPKTAAGRVGESSGDRKMADKTDKEAGALAAARLALQKTMDDASLALQQEYLKQAASINENAFKDNLLTVKEFYDSKLEIETRSITLSIEAKRKELAEAVKAENAGGLKEVDKVKFQIQQAKVLGEINVLEAQRRDLVRSNANDYVEAERARADALFSIKVNRTTEAAQAQLDIERGAIEQARALRQIDDQQVFEMQREVADRSYQISMESLNARRQLVRGDMVKQAELDAEAETIYTEHQAKITEIDRRAVLERRQVSLNAADSIRSAFSTMFNEIMSGTVRLSDVIRNFAMNVANVFQNLIAQRLIDKLFGAGTAGGRFIDGLIDPIIKAIDTIIQKWILGQAAMTTATAVGTSERSAIEKAASLESIATTATTAITNIAAKAWEAAAAVYASIASIPFVGPFLAPAMAVAAGAAVIGFAGRIASAKDGWWQVPGDQIANIHKDEMVMPAAEAEGLREVIRGGGGGGRGSTNITINAMDAVSVRRLFEENGGALVEALRNQERNFAV